MERLEVERQRPEVLVERELPAHGTEQRAGEADRHEAEEAGRAADELVAARADARGRADRDLPTLILLDLGLPGVSGLDVLRRLRAEPVSALLPVVIVTASGDDDEAILRLLTGQIRRMGFPVRSVGDGQEALKVAVQEPRPVLVVSDVNMPGLSGLDLLRRIKRLSSTTQVRCGSKMQMSALEPTESVPWGRPRMRAGPQVSRSITTGSGIPCSSP